MKINIACSSCGKRIWAEYFKMRERIDDFITPTECLPCTTKREQKMAVEAAKNLKRIKEAGRQAVRDAYRKNNP